MRFRSTRSIDPTVDFREAVLSCLPLDGGLYIPSQTMDLRQFFLYMDDSTSYSELVATITPALFSQELNPMAASRVAGSAFAFEPEIVRLDERLSILKLDNGPTGVFKDFGIAFLAALIEELLRGGGAATILTATTGDTGASVARAFAGRKNVVAVILYPDGPVRGVDPARFVSAGGNILPIRVRGSFDDCQRLIREAFEDRPFSRRYGLTSANTINVGRLIPQSFYFLYAFAKLKRVIEGDFFFSVPSGNFGNLIAGLYAWKFGMPVNGFIAAMNANDACGDLLRGGAFTPKDPMRTASPSMDVGNPSNAERLTAFYQEAPAVMRNMVYPMTVSDPATYASMERAWKKYRVLLDPHGAVAFAAGECALAGDLEEGHVVVLATGNPARSMEAVRVATGQIPEGNDDLVALSRVVDPVAVIPARLDALEAAVSAAH